MRPRTLALGVVGLAVLAGAARGVEVASPDGGVRFELSAGADGHLAYAVRAGERPRIQPSRVGIIVDGVDLGRDAEVGAVRLRRISETFPWRGNQPTAANVCTVGEIPVRTRAGVEWALEVRVFDDGAAFRYHVPGTGRRHVGGEATRWRLPAEATVWFQTDTDDYEGAYHSSRADAVPREETVDGQVRATHLGPPVTVVYPNGGYALLTEASLSAYSGMTLRPEGGATFAATFKDDPAGWAHEGPVRSPWRVVVLSPELDGLVNSPVIAALGEPPDPRLFPDGLATGWIRPGKAPCTWMVFGNDGAQWDRQRWWVDRAAAMGCEYLLVDAGWRTERWGWLRDGGDVWARAAELCRYAAARGVGIFLWHAYPESRDDGPGLTTVAAREEFFRRCREAGVKGVKIDFFNSESKATIEACEDLLRRAAAHQLMVSLHGCPKPTGEMRTWPNEITREGIREQEYVLWETLPLAHYGALPFTRMAAGHADFLPGYVQPRFLKNTTLVFQLASAVVFNSPFLCWSDHPDAYLASPALAFVRDVPVTWDETRVLAGSEIGETVILARRKAADWYVAVLNCRPESQVIELDLAALGATASTMTTYQDRGDGAADACRIETAVRVPDDGRVSIDLRAGGGFLARLGPPPVQPGWK